MMKRFIKSVEIAERNRFGITNYFDYKSKINMFVYADQFGVESKSLVMKAQINKPNIIHLPKKNIPFLSNSNTKYPQEEPAPFKSPFIEIPINIFTLNTPPPPPNQQPQEILETILDRMKQVEHLHCTDNNPTIHLFTENDYIENHLYETLDGYIDFPLKDSGKENNIFFLDTEKSAFKCSTCCSYDAILKELDTTNNNNVEYLATGNTLMFNNGSGGDEQTKTKFEYNQLGECSECKSIVHKEINQLINLQRIGESLLKTGEIPKYVSNPTIKKYIASNLSLFLYTFYI